MDGGFILIVPKGSGQFRLLFFPCPDSGGELHEGRDGEGGVQGTASTYIAGFRALILLGQAAEFSGGVPLYEVNCSLGQDRCAKRPGMKAE